MTTNNPVNVNLSGQTGTANFVGSTAPTFTTSWKYAASGFAVLDNNGNNQFTFTTTASAVNYINFTNNSTTHYPQISGTGSDTDVGIHFQTKGVGNFTFTNDSAINMLTLTPIASGVNYFAMTAATTGNAPTFQSAGTDSNVGWTISSKGTGSFTFLSNNAVTPLNAFTITPSSTPVNYITTGSSNTGVAIPFTATGTDSNITISLDSKGTGGVKVKGFSDASAAAAGYVGEVFTSSVAGASGTNIATSTATDLTSITLTAGDWDVYGNVFFTPTATLTFVAAWVSTTSATTPDVSLRAQMQVAGIASAGLTVPVLRVNVSTSTTVYVSGFVVIASGTCKQSGAIFARRVR